MANASHRQNDAVGMSPELARAFEEYAVDETSQALMQQFIQGAIEAREHAERARNHNGWGRVGRPHEHFEGLAQGYVEGLSLLDRRFASHTWERIITAERAYRAEQE